MKGNWLLLCLCACRAPAAEPANPAADNVSIPPALLYGGPALQHSRTAHGLMVALHDPGPDEAAFTLTLVVPFGSAHDPQDSHGAAFTAAVLFGHAGVSYEGMELEGADLTSWLEERGVERHAEAYPEHLALTVAGPAPLAAPMMRLLCALAFDPRVDAPAYNDVETDVTQAFDDRNDGNSALAQEVLTSLLFEGHAVGRPAVPDAVPRALNTLAFLHGATSRPEDIVLVAATHDAAAVMAAAQSCHPTRTAPTPPALPAIKPYAATAQRRVGLAAAPTGTVHIRYGGRAPLPGTPEMAALQAALETLANGFSSSLVTELRTRRGLVYGVEAGVLCTRNAATWFVGTSTSDANAPAVVDTLVSALAEVHAKGLSTENWQRMARANALGFAQGADSVEGLMALEVEHFRLGRAPNASWATPRLWWNMDPKSGADVASQWLDPQKSVLVILASEGALKGPLKTRVDETLNLETWP